jgi:predicted O-methyltransferase YrrM
MKEYIPRVIYTPKVVDVPSAWKGLEGILHDLINRFGINPNLALEFGVEHGFSTSALASYFRKVIGVDPFGEYANFSSYLTTMRTLRDYPNVSLVNMGYEDFIKVDVYDRYDLIHVDISNPDHNYATTYPCGEWSVQHSDCVIFHDTISYPDVMRVCKDLANKYDLEFYNFPDYNGLGILVRKYE